MLLAEIQNVKDELRNATEEENETSSKLNRINELRHAYFAKQTNREVEFGFLKKLAQNARSAYEESESAKSKIKQAEQDISRSYQVQQSIREQQKTALADFSSYYDAICKHVLGRNVQGDIRISQRHIQLNVDERGPLTSAAIETIKVLSFDLASLWYIIEGKGFHPALLIHDGPREADMDSWIYRRFFEFVNMLERAYDCEKEPAFQYIITTTEAPPERLQHSPWLLNPVLSAQKAEDRLLKSDLH